MKGAGGGNVRYCEANVEQLSLLPRPVCPFRVSQRFQELGMRVSGFELDGLWFMVYSTWLMGYGLWLIVYCLLSIGYCLLFIVSCLVITVYDLWFMPPPLPHHPLPSRGCRVRPLFPRPVCPFRVSESVQVLGMRVKGLRFVVHGL